MKSLLALACFMLSSNLLANTPLQSSKDSISVAGVSPQGVEVSALGMYEPAAQSKDCVFAEDKTSPNGALKILDIKAVAASGSYQLNMPVRGKRGSCSYVLTSVYMFVKSKSVYEPIRLDVDSADKDLLNFDSPKTMFCEFSASQAGLCQMADDIVEGAYKISSGRQQIQFDIKDSQEAPQTTDSN